MFYAACIIAGVKIYKKYTNPTDNSAKIDAQTQDMMTDFLDRQAAKRDSIEDAVDNADLTDMERKRLAVYLYRNSHVNGNTDARANADSIKWSDGK